MTSKHTTFGSNLAIDGAEGALQTLTVTGDETVTGVLTANTVSATTYLGLPDFPSGGDPLVLSSYLSSDLYSTGTYQDITSISCTPGTWLIIGHIDTYTAGNSWQFGIQTVSGGANNDPANGPIWLPSFVYSDQTAYGITRFTFTTTTTVTLRGYCGSTTLYWRSAPGATGVTGIQLSSADVTYVVPMATIVSDFLGVNLFADTSIQTIASVTCGPGKWVVTGYLRVYTDGWGYNWGIQTSSGGSTDNRSAGQIYEPGPGLGGVVTKQESSVYLTLTTTTTIYLVGQCSGGYPISTYWLPNSGIVANKLGDYV